MALSLMSSGGDGLTNAMVCCANMITNWPSPWNENAFKRYDDRYFTEPSDAKKENGLLVTKNMQCVLNAYAKSCVSGNVYLKLNNTEIVASTGPNDVRNYNQTLHLKAGDFLYAQFTNQGQIIRYTITWICDE